MTHWSLSKPGETSVQFAFIDDYAYCKYEDKIVPYCGCNKDVYP